MTAPNVNTRWARTLVDELATGIDAVCIAPGSRSTPLALAFAAHDEVEVFSHLDERSAGFFALGRSRRTGIPTAVVCTSGTAAANFHPAVLEASESRVPLLVLTADRPPELHDSGANQTIDQNRLYGGAVRWFRTLAEPEADGRKLRSLRVTADRAVAEATGVPAGPVHLNVPFAKPLEPTDAPGEVPESFDVPDSPTDRAPYVETRAGTRHAPKQDLQELARAVDDAERGLVVCGPADEPTPERAAVVEFARQANFPILADPLSGIRFGPHVPDDGEVTPDAESADGDQPVPVCGGYDSYLDGSPWPAPDIVLRFGASPTSKVLRTYLAGTDARQILVDPAGEWREATFTASDLVVADPADLLDRLAANISHGGSPEYRERFARAESDYWELVDREASGETFEGNILRTVANSCPAPATLFVSNSMPVRDLDRFGRPRAVDLRVLGNRGVSGIDGITSTALGAGSATDEPLVLVTGDLAYYHDMNGLLALARCGVDATIVLVDNDGGGIFHKLPIEEFDPPFTDLFRTPHGLDFEPTGDIYDFDFERIDDIEAFESAFAESVRASGTQVLSVEIDAEASHRFREDLHGTMCDSIQ